MCLEIHMETNGKYCDTMKIYVVLKMSIYINLTIEFV